MNISSENAYKSAITVVLITIVFYVFINYDFFKTIYTKNFNTIYTFIIKNKINMIFYILLWTLIFIFLKKHRSNIHAILSIILSRLSKDSRPSSLID